jgi:hypothetical protein
MYDNRQVIETYRNADEDLRQSLFLQFPGLRNAFVQIDLAEYENLKIDQSPFKSGPTPCRRMLLWAVGLFKPL